MRPAARASFFLAAVALAITTLTAGIGVAQDGVLKPLDVIYVPTSPQAVREMLTLAEVKPGDVVYDLGSGDGRIVIAAVKDFGAARGVGIELDPVRIAEANANAKAAGVSDRVRFRRADLFEVNLSPATVIAMYLLPELNLKLLPKLRALKPGTRIVSHNYGFDDEWPPERSVNLRTDLVMRWTVGRP
ncbi:MAG: cyclopropane-fatty-acyl-phospholipid synthase family protein [Vicinamibacterales bacterium]